MTSSSIMMRSSCTFVCVPTTADVGTCADTVREEEIVAIYSLDLLRGRRGDHGQLRRNLGREQAVNVFTIEKQPQNYNTVNTTTSITETCESIIVPYPSNFNLWSWEDASFPLPLHCLRSNPVLQEQTSDTHTWGYYKFSSR